MRIIRAAYDKRPFLSIPGRTCWSSLGYPCAVGLLCPELAVVRGKRQEDVFSCGFPTETRAICRLGE
jgi:hypothetical protein